MLSLKSIECHAASAMLLNARTDNADAGIGSGRQSGRVLSLAMGTGAMSFPADSSTRTTGSKACKA